MRPLDPSDLSPEQRRLEVAAILARGILVRRAGNLSESAAAPLDSTAETRLSVSAVNGAESVSNKPSRQSARTPRRLSPQHPSTERASHG
jgi:hypothetical protein